MLLIEQDKMSPEKKLISIAIVSMQNGVEGPKPSNIHRYNNIPTALYTISNHHFHTAAGSIAQ